MFKKKLVIMGIDHGNGYFKGYSSKGKEFVHPSGFLTKENSLREDSTGAGQAVQYNEFESTLYPGERYVWGNEVNIAKSKFLSTYTTEDRYAQKYYKLLSQFGLASLINEEEGSFDVLLITGCPSREKGTRRELELIQIFKDRHVVLMNGKEKNIHVKECKVLPQPLGSILDLYIDEAGNVIRDEIASSYIGIVDIGSGTTDCDGIDSLNAIPDDRHTIQVGVHEIYQRLADYINSINPDAYATPEKVEVQFENDDYQASKRLVIPIKEVKERIVRETAEYLINQLQKRWRNRSKFDMIILTGGGAKLMAPWFKEFIKDIHVTEDYQISNARGFFKFGLLIAKEYELEDIMETNLVLTKG
ncbi:plasmid segregation protein ParM domain-containing protein [Paenibacillus thermotolerans]|uniref:ParM/StbA family protein n=1 Tax=Paenibacillus thermotolerans TaxID=3027807 RepID=UPI00236765CC|nr:MULTISPECIES: plasmid segregation protein ParM domain-containing protein [unclassified Paenibacillus]